MAGKAIPRIDGHWFSGNLADFKRNPHEFLAKAGPADAGLFQFRLFHKSMVSIVDVPCAEYIFKTNNKNFLRGHQFKNLQAILGLGLITLEGEIWKSHRRLVAPAFKSEFLQQAFSQNVTLVETQLLGWQEAAQAGEAIDVVDGMRRLTLAVIMRALYSIDIDLDANRKLYQAIVDANDLIFRRHSSLLNFPAWVPTPLNREVAQIRAAMDAFTAAQLKAKQSQPARSQQDIVDYLLGEKLQGALSSAELFDEIRTLCVAGFETTATSLAWALYLLARSPRVAERWRREIDEVLQGRRPDWNDIPRLSYTEHIIMEALRLYPPAYAISRKCMQDDTVEGYAIKAETPVLLSIYGIQRSPRYWLEPDEFRPERFEGDWPQQAFIPFGIGKHGCIGNRFAILESVLILASIGQRFEFALVDEREVLPAAKVTLLPSGPIKLRLTPRPVDGFDSPALPGERLASSSRRS